VRQGRQALWNDKYLPNALILDDLFKHITECRKSVWEYDGFSRKTTSSVFLKSLEASFVENGSHGAQGALILMSLIDEPIARMQDPADRKYLYRHLALAALSVLFHDSSVRNMYLSNGITNLRIADFPIASLLTYVDILQDDRRDLSGSLTRADIFKDVIGDDGSVSVQLNVRLIDSGRKTKLLHELKEAFVFFLSNGLKFLIPQELLST